MISIPGRIPIRIHPLFWFLAVFIGWNYTGSVPGTIVCVLVILVSVLIHEFGHALTALAFGQEPVVYLVAFGGLTTRSGRALKRWQDFLVTLNGPFAGLLAFTIAFFIRPQLPNLPLLSDLAITVFIFVNLYWSLLNLLPLIPLDGGRLMAIVFEGLFGVRGLQLALGLSIIFSLLLSTYLFSTGAHLGGILVLIFAFESLRELRSSWELSPMDRDDSITRLYAQAQSHLAQGKVGEAVPFLEEIREKTGKGMYYTRASIDLASIQSQSGEVEKAYLILLPVKRLLEGDAIQLLHQLAFSMGEWKEAIETGMDSYRSSPDYEKAFAIALCHARLGDAKSVMGWLERAVHDGMPTMRESLDRAEFDAMRQHPEFRAFKESIGG